jgi:hypothetical protein
MDQLAPAMAPIRAEPMGDPPPAWVGLESLTFHRAYIGQFLAWY